VSIGPNPDPRKARTQHIEAAVHVLKDKSTMVAGDKKAKLSSAIEQLDKVVDVSTTC
jgi:hypothetical protein